MKRNTPRSRCGGWTAGLLVLPNGDGDCDGVADLRSVLLEGMNSPFGMAVVDDALDVATT